MNPAQIAAHRRAQAQHARFHTEQRSRKAAKAFSFTRLDELRASPVLPLPAHQRADQLARMRAGLDELRTAAHPRYDAWRNVADAANLLETLVAEGYAADPDGAVTDAITELAVCGARHLEHGTPLRLSGQGIGTLQAAIDDYETCLAGLSARTAIRLFRLTEKRMADVLAGRGAAHDVQVVAV